MDFKGDSPVYIDNLVAKIVSAQRRVEAMRKIYRQFDEETLEAAIADYIGVFLWVDNSWSRIISQQNHQKRELCDALAIADGQGKRELTAKMSDLDCWIGELGLIRLDIRAHLSSITGRDN